MPNTLCKRLTLISCCVLFILITTRIVCTHPSDTMALAILFQSVPLLFPMPGLLSGKPYTYAWSSFLALYYFMLGVSDAAVQESRYYGLAVSALSAVLFGATLIYARRQGRYLRRARGTQERHIDPDSAHPVPGDTTDRRHSLPWGSTIAGVLCLAPMGFLFSAHFAQGAYLAMLFFPFALYCLVMLAGFFIGFALKLASTGRIRVTLTALIGGLNYISFASCLIIVVWLFTQY